MRDSHKVGLLTALSVLSQVTSTLLTLLLVRVLDQETYGSFRQLLLVADTASGLLLLALPSSLMYFLPRLTPPEQKGFVLQTVVILMLCGLASSGLVLWTSTSLAAHFSNAYMGSFAPLMAGYSFLAIAGQYVSAMYLAVGRFKAASIVQVAIALSRGAATAVAVLLFRTLEPVLWALAIFLAVQLAAIYGATYYTWKGTEARWQRGWLGEQARYALPLGLSGVLWYLGKEIDKYYLALMFTPVQYAVFVVGATDVPVFREISTALSSILISPMSRLAAERRFDEISNLWRETIRKSALAFIPASMLLATVAEPLIALLFTADYLGAAWVFRIYSALIVLRIFNSHIVLQGFGKTYILSATTVAFIVLNLGFNVLSVQGLGMGIEGPALATIVSYAITAVPSWTVAQRALGKSFSDCFPTVAVVRTVAASLLGTALALGVDAMLPKGFYFVRLAAGGVGFTVGFIASALALRVATRDDVEIVVGPLRKGLSTILPG